LRPDGILSLIERDELASTRPDALCAWLAKHKAERVHAGLEATDTDGETPATHLHDTGAAATSDRSVLVLCPAPTRLTANMINAVLRLATPLV